MTTTRARVDELATQLEHEPFSFSSPGHIAERLRVILASTEMPEQAHAGTTLVEPDQAAQLRLSALGEAVTAATAHMSVEQPGETVARAEAFYAFLSGSARGRDLDEQEQQLLDADRDTRAVLTPEEAGLAADWYDRIAAETDVEVPTPDQELALRLRRVQDARAQA